MYRPGRDETAYYSMEIAISDAIPTFSGGLGVLAGDHVRSAADRGIRLVAVTLLYRFGFFRPFRTRRRGMCPAPWHLSHAPSAQAALAAIDIDMVARAVRGSDLLGRELVLEMLPDIFRDHVLDVDGPMPAR